MIGTITRVVCGGGLEGTSSFVCAVHHIGIRHVFHE